MSFSKNGTLVELKYNNLEINSEMLDLRELVLTQRIELRELVFI